MTMDDTSRSSAVERVRALRRDGRHEAARELAVQLTAVDAHNALLQFECACVHDHLGREADAVPYYRAAIAGALGADELRRAYIGLGSTYRVLGRYTLAEATLREGLQRYPDAPELKTFLAMVLHNLGRSKQAIELLLQLLADSSADENVRAYAGAIRFYAQDIDRAWPAADAGGHG